MKVELRLPEKFDDYYAWEVEEKGVFTRAIASCDGREAPITFYDPVRLAQYVEEEVRARRFFADRHVVVVERVNRENMTAAVEALGPEFFA